MANRPYSSPRACTWATALGCVALGLLPVLMVAQLNEVSRAYRRFAGGDVAVGRVLADGGELEAGGRRWRAAERPGHSPTDTTLGADGLLLAGDH